MTNHEVFLRKAVTLAVNSAVQGTGPFGCLIVQGDQIVGQGWNQVTALNDPTAHAEIQAIRNATQTLQTFRLDGCRVYTSARPCPMCLGALYWSRISEVYYAATTQHAHAAGFDDRQIEEELCLPDHQKHVTLKHIALEEAQAPFQTWKQTPHKILY